MEKEDIKFAAQCVDVVVHDLWVLLEFNNHC